eukprot:c18910_g1_i2.p1 GENE.c18910_g1_i2~~c18910_g1_i2.p1  ORF type:complete len:691 (+),score=152.13 c18910_g1_i2:46-2118(+)
MASFAASSTTSQEEFMQLDQCIVVDENDVVIGAASKKDSHTFNAAQPRGKLHRAFSVFLFDPQGRLLLQQRAASKITFPNVWTNTCCSHPLYVEDELDSDESIASGTVMGAKRAAQRKLEHELGIPPSQVPLSSFKFLTRLHYWAADTVTHGPNSPWGEHEIDYILFAQLDIPIEQVRASFNREEIGDVQYVTEHQLQQLMSPAMGLLWSPWFALIVEQFLHSWWADLKTTLTTNRYVDCRNIHRLNTSDVPRKQVANLGVKKQGAYGKVRTHTESTLRQLTHVDEVMSALRLKLFSPLSSQIDLKNSTDENIRFCQLILEQVSRSFAAVIMHLPQGLCVEVMIFYLTLRALDTVEDDMQAFKNIAPKLELLKTFHHVALETNWTADGIGEGHERVLLQEFHRVRSVYAVLDPNAREIIKEITQRMGEGMADFASKDLKQGTTTLAEYERYCHFVAGLVGIGLSRLFSMSGFESKELAQKELLSNSMGLFLQKTNIIRDYLEDLVDGRTFYPQEVWRQYASDLGEFASNPHNGRGVSCINHLVTDALYHIPDCISYLSQLNHPAVFRFCAIPQVMAIATLAKCYNNSDVLTGVVKIRKGLTCKLILQCTDLEGVKIVFNDFLLHIKSVALGNLSLDPNANNTILACDKALLLTQTKLSSSPLTAQRLALVCVPLAIAAGFAYSRIAKQGF